MCDAALEGIQKEYESEGSWVINSLTESLLRITTWGIVDNRADVWRGVISVQLSPWSQDVFKRELGPSLPDMGQRGG